MRVSQGLPVSHHGRNQGSPEGWPAALGCGQSLWDVVLQPPREARGVIHGTLLPHVPGDVCHGQSDLRGPWEDTAEALVTGVKHRCCH